MDPTTILVIVGVATIVFSILGSLVAVAFKTGGLVRDIEQLKLNYAKIDQLYLDVGVMKTDLAEIKGMFRLTIRRED